MVENITEGRDDRRHTSCQMDFKWLTYEQQQQQQQQQQQLNVLMKNNKNISEENYT